MLRWALKNWIDKFEQKRNCDAGYIRDRIDTSPRAARLFSPVAGLLAAAVVLEGIALAAQVSVQPATVSVYTVSPGRIGAVVGAVVGLIGAVIGGRALTRSAGRSGAGERRRGAMVAVVLGSIGLLMGGLVVATAKGGLGTGNGLGGGVVAMAVGLIGMALGGRALARSRRTV